MIYLILYIYLGTSSVNSLSASDPKSLYNHHCEEFTTWKSVADNAVIASGTQKSVAICSSENNSLSASDHPTKDCFVPRNDEKKTYRNEVFTQSEPLFKGIHKVHVSLEPKSIPAKAMALFVKPEGDTYIKLTPTENGAIQIQFCDEKGNIRVSANNGTGFYAGAMPKRLYLTDVKFRYEEGKIVDAQSGRNKVKVLPCADCSGKDKKWTEEQIQKKTKLSEQAVIIPKIYSGIFEIEIKLNLSVAFNAVIKEIKQ